MYLKGMLSKLTMKFWMCQKCCKMKDYNQKKKKKKKERKTYLQVLKNDYKHTGYDNNYKINLAMSF
jgi:hypothetical protein